LLLLAVRPKFCVVVRVLVKPMIGLLALKDPPVEPATVRVTLLKVNPAGTGKVEPPLNNRLAGVLPRLVADPATRGAVKVSAEAAVGVRLAAKAKADAVARVVARIAGKRITQ
jgi:hypothetical protein